MQAAQILAQADALFAAGNREDAVALLENAYGQARREGDWQTRLTLVNELMGYWRATGRFDGPGPLRTRPGSCWRSTALPAPWPE